MLAFTPGDGPTVTRVRPPVLKKCQPVPDRRKRRTQYGGGSVTREYVQQNQADGVPPLALTGERTLPDVPEENYWYRRHLVVYEWIAERVAGSRVVDMACGEGYGSNVLAAGAASVVGVDANPEAHEHARLRYARSNLRFERDLVESFAEPCDAVVFLQTIEHVQDAGAILEHFKSMLGRHGVAYVSTPNLLTLAPPGAEKSNNPWHIKEYREAEFRELCEAHFERVELFGLFHARKLRAHEIAIKLGWDGIHGRLGLTKPFYDRFTPAIAASDFRLAGDSLDRALDFLAVCRV
jgi:2-polyprenyl-3-methyl-5-hydroxy-6-metoxy-1,4-benzoquinol methylase